MMKRVVYFLIIGILLLSVSSFFIFRVQIQGSPQNIDWGSCKTLRNNGEGMIDLVFLSSKDNAEKFSDYLFSVGPYSSNKDFFNVFYIDGDPSCSLYNDIALYCYSKDNIKKASICPNDFVVALSDGYDSGIRSSTYMNFISLNSKHLPKVIAHEFAHALANLADEYVPASIPRGAENCVNECSDFMDDVDGCYLGCSKPGLFRPVDYGIMRSLTANSFGLFDSSVINNRILEETGRSSSTITGGVVDDGLISCPDSYYYLVEGSYDNGAVVINSKSFENGCVGSSGFGDFSYELLLDDGSVYSGGEFNPELVFAESQSESQSEIIGDHFVNNGIFYLKIPVVDNAKSLVIIKDDSKLAEITLNDDKSRFCRI